MQRKISSLGYLNKSKLISRMRLFKSWGSSLVRWVGGKSCVEEATNFLFMFELHRALACDLFFYFMGNLPLMRSFKDGSGTKARQADTTSLVSDLTNQGGEWGIERANSYLVVAFKANVGYTLPWSPAFRFSCIVGWLIRITIFLVPGQRSIGQHATCTKKWIARGKISKKSLCFVGRKYAVPEYIEFHMAVLRSMWKSLYWFML